MKKIVLILSFFISNWILSYQSMACINGANYCSTKFTGNVNSKFCAGRPLPESRTRNFHFDGSWELVCNANADHFIRRPQKYDFNKWIDLKERNPEAAFDYRQTLPKIEWSGTIPYQTIEKWKWEECSYDSNSMICGTRRECHSESRTSCTTDNKGKQHCRNYKEEVCHDVACSCWYDHVRNESLHCSNEQMSFSASFNRPSKEEWNIQKSPMNATFLPNKYDLLIGETEDVQIFNNSSTSTQLNPKVEVGNAWNFYEAQITGSGSGASCRMKNPTEIKVTIFTKERKIRACPNPFMIAQNQFGEELDPIESWDTKNDDEDDNVQKIKPKSIRLMDSSAALTQAIAEHSRRNAEREILKDSIGQSSNPDGMKLSESLANEFSSQSQQKEGFFKNTIIRLQLKKINKWWWPDEWTLNKKYSSDGESVVSSLTAFSAKQDIANSDMWVIDLMGDGDTSKNSFYRLQKLMPDRKYKILVSVYQKGVDIYQQDCDTHNAGWKCNPFIRFIGLGIGENDYFSKPIEVPFATDPGYDERPYITGIDLWNVNQGIPYIRWIYNPGLLFEKMISEKPMNQK